MWEVNCGHQSTFGVSTAFNGGSLFFPKWAFFFLSFPNLLIISCFKKKKKKKANHIARNLNKVNKVDENYIYLRHFIWSAIIDHIICYILIHNLNSKRLIWRLLLLHHLLSLDHTPLSLKFVDHESPSRSIALKFGFTFMETVSHYWVIDIYGCDFSCRWVENDTLIYNYKISAPTRYNIIVLGSEFVWFCFLNPLKKSLLFETWAD